MVDDIYIYISRRKFLSGLIASSALVFLSPIVSTARSLKPQENAGLKIETSIEGVKEFNFDLYKLLYIKSHTIVSLKGLKKYDAKVSAFTLRGIVNGMMEPSILFIDESTSGKTTIIAYADDEEYMIKSINKSQPTTKKVILSLLNSIESEASNKGFKKLVRYIDIIKKSIEVIKGDTL